MIVIVNGRVCGLCGNCHGRAVPSIARLRRPRSAVALNRTLLRRSAWQTKFSDGADSMCSRR